MPRAERRPGKAGDHGRTSRDGNHARDAHLDATGPGRRRFADVACPSFDERADRTVCYHAVEPIDADLPLAVEPEVFDPYLGDDTVEVLRFTLSNRSAWHIQFNPYAWGLVRYVSGEWGHVAPDAVPEPLTALPPGETYTWELPSQLHPTPNRDRWMLLDVTLQAGVYAFHVAGRFGTGFDPDTPPPRAEPPDEWVECVGLVRLDDDVDPGATIRSPKTTVTGSRPDEPVTSTDGSTTRTDGE